MSKPFLVAFGVAVILIAGLIWWGFRGDGRGIAGADRKDRLVRTLGVGDDLTYMVIDFNVRNDSDRDMVVRTVDSVIPDTADRGTVKISPDFMRVLKSAFEFYPALGEQYNPVLKERDVVPPHQSLDRMVGFRVDAPVAKVEGRKRVTLHGGRCHRAGAGGEVSVWRVFSGIPLNGFSEQPR